MICTSDCEENFFVIVEFLLFFEKFDKMTWEVFFVGFL